MMTNQIQAIILLLEFNDTDKHNYIATQIRLVSLQKQKHYLTEFCQALRFDILETIEVSWSGIEFNTLANTLKDKHQPIVFIAENFKSLTRQPEAFLAFHQAFRHAIETRKIYLLSAHNTLILEPVRNLIHDMRDFLQVVTYLVKKT